MFDESACGQIWFLEFWFRKYDLRCCTDDVSALCLCFKYYKCFMDAPNRCFTPECLVNSCASTYQTLPILLICASTYQIFGFYKPVERNWRYSLECDIPPKSLLLFLDGMPPLALNYMLFLNVLVSSSCGGDINFCLNVILLFCVGRHWFVSNYSFWQVNCYHADIMSLFFFGYFTWSIYFAWECGLFPSFCLCSSNNYTRN